MTDKEWILNRMSFAAQTIEEWKRLFGDEKTKRMVRNTRFARATRVMLDTAFGD